jgi:hypothetical protein
MHNHFFALLFLYIFFLCIFLFSFHSSFFAYINKNKRQLCKLTKYTAITKTTKISIYLLTIYNTVKINLFSYNICIYYICIAKKIFSASFKYWVFGNRSYRTVLPPLFTCFICEIVFNLINICS